MTDTPNLAAAVDAIDSLLEGAYGHLTLIRECVELGRPDEAQAHAGKLALCLWQALSVLAVAVLRPAG